MIILNFKTIVFNSIPNIVHSHIDDKALEIIVFWQFTIFSDTSYERKE